ncbi:MAG: hydrogenase formation protein HypD [Desulfobacterales bacterium]|nr:hydrogenase formation protein HypD [Desulfobacterales bacterium]
MPLKHAQEYRDPVIARRLADRIAAASRRPIRLMEVCGTHTMSIFRHGIRSLLPETITLLSGPGCPVCVTAQSDIDAFIALARMPEVIVATFGDLMRVPGTGSSLQLERAAGADIRIVYSTFDALTIAAEHPDKKIVFLGVGFETTAPTIAASLSAARDMGRKNFFVFSAHKLVPPALEALMHFPGVTLDGFILPGHVSVILGEDGYRSFFERFSVPCVITGFEPVDILQGIFRLAMQVESGAPALENAYPRAVTAEGNQKARQLMNAVFEPADAAWRGLGTIAQSGLKIRATYADFDAARHFDLALPEPVEPKGCACGDILTGAKTPPECALFKTACTPMDPVGPCMVSSEGTCAAYYRYTE